ncbi:MAG: class I SAM-dependent methyltransferase [Smithellaceae bacterium]
MPNKRKGIKSGLADGLKPHEIGSAAATVPKDVDPRVCGLLDAVKRGWYQLETGELFTGFKVSRDDIVLDVGCGEGNATLFCARQGAHVAFSDIDAEKITALIKKVKRTRARKVEGFVSDTTPLPLPDEYATRILSTEILEHTPKPEKIMSELVRVGKPGALYLITVPDSRSEMLQKPVAAPVYFSEPNHIQIIDKKSFVRLVENSGLKVERYDTWGFYWTFFMSVFWLVHQEECFHDAVLDCIKPPYHPVLQSWSNTWAELMKLNGSERLMESLDKYLPKTQVIIARKK